MTETKTHEQVWKEIKAKNGYEVNVKTAYTMQKVKPSIIARQAYKMGVGYSAILEAEKYMEKKDRFGRLLATAHLCMTEAIHMFDEAEELCDPSFKHKYGYSHKSKMVEKAFKDYNDTARKNISGEQLKNMVLDFKDFDTSVRYWSNLNGWKETNDVSDEEATHAMILGIHSNLQAMMAEYLRKRSNGDSEKLNEERAKLMQELMELDKKNDERRLA